MSVKPPAETKPVVRRRYFWVVGGEMRADGADTGEFLLVSPGGPEALPYVTDEVNSLQLYDVFKNRAHLYRLDLQGGGRLERPGSVVVTLKAPAEIQFKLDDYQFQKFLRAATQSLWPSGGYATAIMQSKAATTP